MNNHQALSLGDATTSCSAYDPFDNKLLNQTQMNMLKQTLTKNTTLGFILLEVNTLNEIAEQLRDDHLNSLLRIILEHATNYFEVYFKECDLLFVKQLGFIDHLLVFTTQENLQQTILDAYNTYRVKVIQAIEEQTLKLSGLKCSLNIGYSSLLNTSESDPNRILFKGYCKAHRVAKIEQDSEWFHLYKNFLHIKEAQLINPVYQPIVNLENGSILGWEAFARGPQNSHFKDPKHLFWFAERVGDVFTIDSICLDQAIDNLGELSPEQRLFVNIHPLTLNDANFTPDKYIQRLDHVGLQPDNIVLELSEAQQLGLSNVCLFIDRIEEFRQHGFSIAIENVGAGNSNLFTFSQIRPDFLKVDISMIRGIESNPFKRVMVETLVLLGEKVNGLVIAEGIESEYELSALTSMGVFGGQGNYLAKPDFVKPYISHQISLKPTHTNILNSDWHNSSSIRELIDSAISVDHKTSVNEVKAMLEETSPISSVVVTQGKSPVGLLMSYNLDRHLSKQYGVSLYSHRSVTLLMDKDPLIADANEQVESVAKKAMNRVEERIYDDIIVTEKDQLIGTVSVQKMLDTLAKIQVELAKGSNPLTGLPGNVVIEQEIGRRTTNKIPSSFLYVDLDNFKVYNDVYGFKNGDKVIKLTAQILRKAVNAKGNKDDFIGHIGGDDFIVITSLNTAEPVAKKVTQMFSDKIPEMYHAEDKQKGYIVGVSRDGTKGKFSFVSVSIGIIDFTSETPFTMEELGQRSAEVKKYAKTKEGNVYVRDRRTPLGHNASS
jgi:diguanylate cyclase (GGDEF)-like protein